MKPGISIIPLNLPLRRETSQLQSIIPVCLPAPDDRTPSVRIDLGEERTVRQIRLFFDTDFDHALENVQMEHFDSVMPQCIRNYRITDGDGNLLFRTEGNHQSCNTIALDAPHTLRSIRFWPEDSAPGRHKALMGIIVE